MHGFKFIERFKSSQVHALNQQDSSTGNTAGIRPRKHNQNRFSFKKGTKFDKAKRVFTNESLLSCALPTTDILEPPIEPYLKPVSHVEALASIYHRIQSCSESEKSLLFLEEFSVFKGLGDPKLIRRSLRAARQHAVDVNSKVVLSAWLRYEKREDELVGVSSMDCWGHILECPKAALVSGYDPDLMNDHCQCSQDEVRNEDVSEEKIILSYEECGDISFCIGGEEIRCVKHRIAHLSSPLKAMLYGDFAERGKDEIDFSCTGLSPIGMRAVELYSRTWRVELFCPEIVLELLSFANRFCCEKLKYDCDAHLASMVSDIEDALVLIEYGLEETACLLVAACLQVLLRELPNSLCNYKVMKIFCTPEARERLESVGHSSFLLYYFLSQVALDENMLGSTTVMLLDRLRECARFRWQQALAMHQLGCVMLERKNYEAARYSFEAAADADHVYSKAGVARTLFKQGQQYSAYKVMKSLSSRYKAVGWIYQERSLYGVGKEKTLDLDMATELDPTLAFPYKYRAVAKAGENHIRAAILEISRIIRFKLSPDCLELRAWFYVAIADYGSALTDIRALLTLEPNYILFDGFIRGNQLLELLGQRVRQYNQADCWMQLYKRWSSVDDIGSLAVIHQMLANEPDKSLLRFRQSLLLLRLNCQKAAMRSLRLARNNSNSEHEKLVYEGWILYDTGHREEAISRADKSISMKQSFEALFLKAYMLADTTLDPESSSYVIQLLHEALKCPSDGLRKGQALNNLASIHVDCGKLDEAAECYKNALEIKHTRAHQGLARVYHIRNQHKDAYEEMTKLIDEAPNCASAYEKRSEYCDRENAMIDLNMATELDPLRTYPYRYRAAVLMDDQKEREAIEELTKAIAFKPDLHMLHLRAAFYESIDDLTQAIRDCAAALCLDPNHPETLDLYSKIRLRATSHVS